MKTISAIYVYPVKSLAGMSVREWPLEKRGLAHDRRWMLVDENGKFFSQREKPEMAFIQASIQGGNLAFSDRRGGRPEFVLPLERARSGVPAQVQIWEDEVTALKVGNGADAWLQQALGGICFLVYMPDDTLRPVDPKYAREEDITGFSDGFPYLITQDSSLADLNEKLDSPVEMIRFRPNLVVQGGAAWEEDHWTHLWIGQEQFRTPKPCARCQLITNDPQTAVMGKEPLRTLSTFRREGHKVLFGMNACWDPAPGSGQGSLVRIGDEVSLRQQP